jgi:ABC-type sugar transport system substrate-binding protein
MHPVRRTSVLVLAGFAVSLGAAACGSSSNDDKSNAGAATTPPATNVSTSAGGGASSTAGTAAGKAAGAAVNLPTGKKIGFLQIVAGIESADRAAKPIENAAKKLGWSYTLCDAAGDPGKMATCANTLMSQGVDAIFTDIGDASVIATAMREARAKNVPVIDVTGKASGFDANYAPDEKRLGKLLSDYVSKKLGQLPDSPVPIATSEFPQPFAQQRTEELKAAVKADPKLKIVASASVDAANLITGTKQSAKDQMTQNPKLKMFWVDFDTAGQAIGQQVASTYPGKKYPDRPMVATFHADLGTVKLMRAGVIDVVADVAYDTASWIGVDQLLELWTRKTPLSQETQTAYGDQGDLYTYAIVDSTNLPADGKYAASKVDPASFFAAKWKAEFGV